MESSKASIVRQLLAAKRKSGKTFDQIAREIGVTNVYASQLLRRQAQLKPDTAAKLRAALPDLSEQLLDEMMLTPMRSYDPNLLQDPAVYRSVFIYLSFGFRNLRLF